MEHKIFRQASFIMIVILASIWLSACAPTQNESAKSLGSCAGGKSISSMWTAPSGANYDLGSLYNNEGRVMHQGPIACGAQTINCTIKRDDVVDGCGITQTYYLTDCSMTNGATTDQLTEWGSFTFEKTAQDTVMACETNSCDNIKVCTELH